MSAELDSCMLHASKVSTDAFDMLEVSLTRCSMKARHSHDSNSNVKSTNRDGPLQHSNEGLVLLDAISIKEL